jgi:hypothetical protein
LLTAFGGTISFQTRFLIGHLEQIRQLVDPIRTACSVRRIGFQRRGARQSAAMNMVDLVMRVCLLANPSDCQDEYLYFESRGSLTQCMFLAPAEIAKWTDQHAGRKVVRWRCAFPDKGRGV